MNFFNQARYIWVDGEENSPSMVRFETWLSPGKYMLSIAVTTVYRIYVNGIIIAYGPARAPHGFARVDQVKFETTMTNSVICIEVTHYAAKTFYYPEQSAFLKCEITDNYGKIVRTSGCNDFDVYRMDCRDWNVEKFTMQRHLIESYDYSGNDPQRVGIVEINPDIKLLNRGAPYPDLNQIFYAQLIHHGWISRARPESMEPKVLACLDTYEWGTAKTENGYSLYDFGRVMTGFIRFVVVAEADSELVLGFDETMTEKIFPGKHVHWGNYFIRIKLDGGKSLEFESFEPYTLRFLAFWTFSGKIHLEGLPSLREYAFDRKLINSIQPQITPGIDRIYKAAVETFRQNTLDVFMDCPGRERAAWLCDSYFTAKTAYHLTGNTEIEESFIENFLLPSHFDGLPAGMLPMCYPADTNEFIPQWPLWLILQISEYSHDRKGERNFFIEFRDTFQRLVAFYEPYLNSDGLPANLPGWNFIEWSGANALINGIHFPTCLLYAESIIILAEAWNDSLLKDKGTQIKQKVISIAFDGYLFHDHAVVDDDGNIHVGIEASETAQYYALLFSGMTKGIPGYVEWEKKVLDRTLVECLEIESAMFIGKVLRYLLLFQHKRHEQMLSEIEKDLMYMVENTGTLWENMFVESSCCHGFASVIAPLIAGIFHDSRIIKQEHAELGTR